MSKYKGGYILVDLSDISITNIYEDLLPSDLKSYLSQFVSDDLFSSEILMKPIEVIFKSEDFDGETHTIRTQFSLLNQDKDRLFSAPLMISYYVVQLIMKPDLTIAVLWTELVTN